jgi:glutamate dehydrogenase
MPETIGALTRHWKERIAALGKSEPGFARFLANAIKSADEQDLALYSPETLEKLLGRTFSHIGERTQGKPDIRLWTSGDTAPDDITIIDIYSADTPFIVDSALAAIRAAGGAIRFMTHPVAFVDPATSPWTVLDAPTEGARTESVLQVHIDTPADTATRDLIATELTQTMIAVRQAVEYAMAQNPGLDIVARAHSEAEEAELRRLGVRRVVVAEREVGNQLLRLALRRFGVSEAEVAALLRERRA